MRFLSGAIGAALGGALVAYALSPSSPQVFVDHAACARGATTVPDYVISLLRCDANGWSGDQFRVTYRDGTAIWIANRDYGITVTRDGGTWSSKDYDDPNKKRIWDAYQDWAARQVLK